MVSFCWFWCQNLYGAEPSSTTEQQAWPLFSSSKEAAQMLWGIKRWTGTCPMPPPSCDSLAFFLSASDLGKGQLSKARELRSTKGQYVLLSSRGRRGLCGKGMQAWKRLRIAGTSRPSEMLHGPFQDSCDRSLQRRSHLSSPILSED